MGIFFQTARINRGVPRLHGVPVAVGQTGDAVAAAQTARRVCADAAGVFVAASYEAPDFGDCDRSCPEGRGGTRFGALRLA